MDAQLAGAIVWAKNALEEIGDVIGTEEFSQALLEAPDEVGMFFEEGLMSEVYTDIENRFGIFLEPSTQCCFGSVDAYSNEGCTWKLGNDRYDFGAEIHSAMVILSQMDVETATIPQFVEQMIDAIKNMLGAVEV